MKALSAADLEENKKKTRKQRIIRAVILGIAALLVLAFLLTQDLNAKATIVDKWTAPMAGGLTAGVILTWLLKKMR